MKPNPAAPAITVSPGVTTPAPPFAVDDALEELGLVKLDDESATCVTTVDVCGGIVVAGTVVAATVDIITVDTEPAVAPLEAL